MAGPRRLPKLDSPRPVHPGKAVTGATGSEIINKILNLRKQEQTSKGVKYEVPTTDILRTAAMGSDDDRALLRQIWDAMPEAQQLEIKRRLIEDMPSATHPTGLTKDKKGKTIQAFSSEAQKILDVLEGKGLDAAATKAAAGSASGSVPKVSKPGPTQKIEGEDATGSYEPDYEAGSTSAEPGGGTHSKEAAEDVKGPAGLRRNEVKGFDPKAAGVHDPGRGQTQVQNRPHFRVDSEAKVGKDGMIVREVDEENSSYARADMPAITAGKRYEEGMAKREELFANLLIAQTGSRQNAAELLNKAMDGDPDAKAILSQIRVMVSSDAPKPIKPRPIEDFSALNTEQTPQAQLDQHGLAIISGNPTTAMYTQRRGQFDTAMAAWQALQTSTGSKALVPNQVFSSPRQMAEQYIRNMSPELFDRPPVTPSQRMDAGDTVRQFGLKDSGVAKQYIADFGDAPLTPEARETYRQQAIDRMAKEFESRFGSQWGEGAQTGTPVGEKIPGTDEYDPASMSPAPLSLEPADPSGTSTDPSELPNTGSPNKAGVHERKPFEQMLAEHMEQKERLLGKVGSDKRFKEYMESDDYVATPSPPTKPPDLDSKLDSPKASTVDGFDPEDYGADAAAALESWKKQQAERGWEVTPGPDGTFTSRPKAKPEGEEPEFEGTEAHWKGMDKDQKLAWSYPDGANEWLADHNARYPMTSADDLAARDRMIGELSDRLPGLAGAGRTSELLKQIDALMEGEGSPAVAAKIKELKAELVRAQRGDAMTGIQSARKPPLGGKIKKPTGDSTTGSSNPADTTPVETTQQKMIAEDDGDAISGRPEQEAAATEEAAAAEGAVAEEAVTPPPEEAAPATDPVPMGMDDAIDPMESASSVDIVDEAATPTPDPESPAAVDPVEANAADNVDEAEAPRDIEAERPAEEASTIPEGTGSEATPNDQTSGTTRQKKDGKPAAGRFPWGTATLATVGGAAGLMGVNHIGSQINQQAAMGGNASGQGGPGAGMPGAEGAEDGGGFPVPLGNTTDNPYGYSSPDPADRIRMIQKLRGYVPTGTPQTLQKWG